MRLDGRRECRHVDDCRRTGSGKKARFSIDGLVVAALILRVVII